VAHCARHDCQRWLPDALASFGRFGIFIDQHWYCSTLCVEEAVRQRVRDLPPVEPAFVQSWRRTKLGLLLTQQMGLSRANIDLALGAQEGAGLPMGQRLRRQGLVSTDELLRALATQAGVRYLTAVNPRIVAHRPGELSPDIVRALGIVPIAADATKRQMQVACTAPIPGLAVRALTKLTEWAVEPLLVSDESLPHLIEVYGTKWARRTAVSGAVCDVLGGPAQVARFAKSRRIVRMLHERCDPYVWVRLDAAGATADVLMALPEMEGGS
jgi:hypothetical protein